MKNIGYKIVKTTEELDQILILQQANHFSSLSEAEKNEQGFVTVQHSLAQLQAMNAASPQFIATAKNKVVGYVLTMNFNMKDTVPFLAPLFEELEQFSYKGLPLNKQYFVICGQTCIHQEYRGLGIMQQLYKNMCTGLSDTYTGCITEISNDNKRSLKAHFKIGFNTIHRYHDGQQEWHIVLWNWNQKS